MEIDFAQKSKRDPSLIKNENLKIREMAKAKII